MNTFLNNVNPFSFFSSPPSNFGAYAQNNITLFKPDIPQASFQVPNVTPNFLTPQKSNSGTFSDALQGVQAAIQAWNAFQQYNLSRQQYTADKRAFNINLDMQTSLLNRNLYNKDVLKSNYLGQNPQYASFQEWLEKSPDAYKTGGL